MNDAREPRFAEPSLAHEPYVASNTYVGPVEKQCEGKVAYASKKLAKRAISRLRNGPIGDLMAYRCPHCTAFHVGHRPQSRRKRKEATSE